MESWEDEEEPELSVMPTHTSVTGPSAQQPTLALISESSTKSVELFSTITAW